MQKQAPPPLAEPPAVAEAAPEVAPAMAPAPPAPAPAGFAAAARVQENTIDTELRHIRELFAQDKRDEARQRLADFHRDHPDYPLPDDLRKQLLQP
jgi:Meckel syndrome type 1 protein